MNDKRDAFEKWYARHTDGNMLKNTDGDYAYMPAQVAWNNWQACAKHYEAKITVLEKQLAEALLPTKKEGV